MRELFLNRDGLLWMMFLRRYQQLQSSGILKTVTGTAPLTLEYALPKAIKSLIQYGKCTQSGTPSSVNPVDIVCNNGTLVAVDDELPLGYKRIESIDFDGDFWYETGKSLRGSDDVTFTVDDTASGGQNLFGSYNGTSSGTKNFSLYIYGGSSTNSCYFRYGEQLLRPKLGSGERTITFGASGTSGFATDATVTPDTFETNANTYIGMLPNSSSPAYTGAIIGNILVSDRLKYIPCERISDGVIGYYEAVNGEFIEPSGTGTPVKGGYDTSHCTRLIVDGTPEVLTITADGATTQTATVQNLFAVGDYKDEQDLITGVVTRRVAVCVYDGTQTIGNTFMSTTGGKAIGAIIVYPLAESITEQVTAQPLSTSEGTNVVSVTAEVSDVPLEIQYKGEFVKTVTGTLLHITDALAKPAKKFVATLEPIQDLHGQDAPYPAGGGVNKFGGAWPPDVSGTYGAWNSGATAKMKLCIYDKGNGADISGVYFGTSETGTGVPITWAVNNGEIQFTTIASGGSFGNLQPFVVIYPNTEAAFNKIMNRFNVNVVIDDAVTDTSPVPYSPYSNICPITGWTECNVYRTGKNLLAKQFQHMSEVTTDTTNYFFIKAGSYIFSFTSTSASAWRYVVRLKDLSGNVIIDSDHNPNTSQLGIRADYYGYMNGGNTTATSLTLNIVEDCYIRILWNIAASDSTFADTQLELGSTATDYEAYQGTTIPIAFPDAAGTVYGCTLTNEDEEWKLRVDRIKRTLNGSEDWAAYSVQNGFVTSISDMARLANVSLMASLSRASWLKNILYLSEYGALFNINGTFFCCHITDNISEVTDLTTWKTYLSANPLDIVYPIATPVEYTLTESQALTLLKGENNIWVDDSDSLELTYLAKAGSTP